MNRIRDIVLARVTSAGTWRRLVRALRRAAALALCLACCVGCAPPRTPADRQKLPSQPAELAPDAAPVRRASFPEFPALQRLADAGAWITVRTTFLPAVNRGTLVEFKELLLRADMLSSVRDIPGDVFINFKHCRFEAGALRPLDRLDNIHALAVIDNTTDDAVLQDVSVLPNLEMFIATSPHFTNEALGLVEKSIRIHYLSLHGALGDLVVPSPAQHEILIELHLGRASITDAALHNIARLPALMRLELTNCGVGDAGVAHLGSLMELCSLDLDGTKVTDAGLRSLQPLKKLETLSLRRTAVSGEGLDALSILPRLETLSLSGTLLDDHGLQGLTRLRALRTLSLKNTKITDAGIVTLAGLPSLDSLDLLGTKVTDAARRAFAPTVSLSIGEEPESAKDPNAR